MLKTEKSKEKDASVSYIWFWILLWFCVTVVAPGGAYILHVILNNTPPNETLLALYISFTLSIVSAFLYWVVSRVKASEAAGQLKLFHKSLIPYVLIPICLIFIGSLLIWSEPWLLIIFYFVVSILGLVIAYVHNRHHLRKHGAEIRPVRTDDILDLTSLAWVVLLIGSVSFVLQWFNSIKGQVQQAHTGFFVSCAVDYQRYLLIAAVTLFIAKMFRKYEEMNTQLKIFGDKMGTELPMLKEKVQEAGIALDNTLSMYKATLAGYQIETVLSRIADESRRNTSLASLYGQFNINLLEGYVQRFYKFITEAAKKGNANVDLPTLLIFLSKYLQLDLYSGLELRTWFPSYANTVECLTKYFLHDDSSAHKMDEAFTVSPSKAARYKFYATLVTSEGFKDFFNIADSGADPLWSVSFLNEFLWKDIGQSDSVKYCRYLLCHGEEDASKRNYFTNERGILSYNSLTNSRHKILCKKVGDRYKAVAIPNKEEWQKKDEAAKEKLLQGFTPEMMDYLSNLSSTLGVDSRMGFSISEKVIPAIDSQFGLEYIEVRDALRQYPPVRPDDVHTGNRIIKFMKDDFEQLFPNGEFYDLFAVRDTSENKWVLCLCSQTEGKSFSTIRLKLYNEAISDTEEWRMCQQRLDNLINKTREMSTPI